MREANFGQVLALLRQRADLTQQQLADVLGVSVTTVSAWERGAYRPQKKMLEKICETFLAYAAFPVTARRRAIIELWEACQKEHLLDQNWFARLLQTRQDATGEVVNADIEKALDGLGSAAHSKLTLDNSPVRVEGEQSLSLSSDQAVHLTPDSLDTLPSPQAASFLTANPQVQEVIIGDATELPSSTAPDPALQAEPELVEPGTALTKLAEQHPIQDNSSATIESQVFWLVLEYTHSTSPIKSVSHSHPNTFYFRTDEGGRVGLFAGRLKLFYLIGAVIGLVLIVGAGAFAVGLALGPAGRPAGVGTEHGLTTAAAENSGFGRDRMTIPNGNELKLCAPDPSGSGINCATPSTSGSPAEGTTADHSLLKVKMHTYVTATYTVINRGDGPGLVQLFVSSRLGRDWGGPNTDFSPESSNPLIIVPGETHTVVVKSFFIEPGLHFAEPYMNDDGTPTGFGSPNRVYFMVVP